MVNETALTHLIKLFRKKKYNNGFQSSAASERSNTAHSNMLPKKGYGNNV